MLQQDVAGQVRQAQQWQQQQAQIGEQVRHAQESAAAGRSAGLWIWGGILAAGIVLVILRRLRS